MYSINFTVKKTKKFVWACIVIKKNSYIISIEEFNSSLLKIDKKSYKDIDIYYIGYITI